MWLVSSYANTVKTPFLVTGITLVTVTTLVIIIIIIIITIFIITIINRQLSIHNYHTSEESKNGQKKNTDIQKHFSCSQYKE